MVAYFAICKIVVILCYNSSEENWISGVSMPDSRKNKKVTELKLAEAKLSLGKKVLKDYLDKFFEDPYFKPNHIAPCDLPLLDGLKKRIVDNAGKPQEQVNLMALAINNPEKLSDSLNLNFKIIERGDPVSRLHSRLEKKLERNLFISMQENKKTKDCVCTLNSLTDAQAIQYIVKISIDQYCKTNQLKRKKPENRPGLFSRATGVKDPTAAISLEEKISKITEYNEIIKSIQNYINTGPGGTGENSFKTILKENLDDFNIELSKKPGLEPGK